MDTIIGLKGKDYVLLAGDTMEATSIFFIKENKTKIKIILPHCMMGMVGDKGDTRRFADIISSNAALYEIRNGYNMDSQTLVKFTRNKLIEYIANNKSSKVAMLLATYDAEKGPNLCFMDALGATHSLNCSGHGWGSTVCYSIFQLLWKPDLSLNDGLDIIHKCISEIQNRIILNLRSFQIFVVDKDGAREHKPATTSTEAT